MHLSKAQDALDISAAEISFVFVNNDVDGTISGFSSSSTIDANNLENSKLEGSVEVATIDTDNSIRNWSLRREKYFDADNHPKITFVSNTIASDGDVLNVVGQLTIKGITKKLTFKFKKTNKQLVGTATLYSSDYGIHIKSERDKNKVNVKIVLHLK